jgi:hypothetical protein
MQRVGRPSHVMVVIRCEAVLARGLNLGSWQFQVRGVLP